MILKERLEKFKEESDNLKNSPSDGETKKIELSEKISKSRNKSNEENDKLAMKENNLREVISQIRDLSDQESRLREQKGRIEATFDGDKGRLLEISNVIEKEHKSEISKFLEEVDISSIEDNESDLESSIDRYKIERDSLGTEC